MSKPWLTVEEEESPEGTTVVIRATFKDQGEPPVELVEADFIALEATILDARTGQVLGDWEDKDVKGNNGGTFNVPDGGLIPSRFALRIPPDDPAMEIIEKDLETRRVLLRWTYNTDDKGAAEVTFPIRKRVEPAA